MIEQSGPLEITIDDEPAGSLLLEVASATDVGLKRTNNEDAVASQLGPGSLTALLVVADGMGGHESGELASRAVVDEIVGSFEDDRLLDAADIERAILLADSTIATQWPGSGSTVVTVMATTSSACLAHVGDSRAYLLRAGRLSLLTSDHTLVNSLVERGNITEAQARTHPRRHVLLQAVGTGRQDPPDTRTIRLQPSDALLLASDGLHGVVPDEETQSVLAGTLGAGASATAASNALIERALAAGAPDNVTVAVLVVREGSAAE